MESIYIPNAGEVRNSSVIQDLLDIITDTKDKQAIERAKEALIENGIKFE